MVGKYKCSLLVVDDEPSILDTLKIFLSSEFDVLTAGCADAAQQIFRQREIDIILTDQKMPRVHAACNFWNGSRRHSPKTIRLMMTGFAELEETISAINKGQVFRFLLKPWHSDNLLETLRTAAQTFVLERSHEQLLDELRQAEREAARDEYRTRKSRRRANQSAGRSVPRARAQEQDARKAGPDRSADQPAQPPGDGSPGRARAAPPRALSGAAGDRPDRRRSLQADQRPLSLARRRQGAGRSGPLPE